MYRIIYFDFCKTLVDFETGNEFVRYVIKKEGSQSIFAEHLRKIISILHVSKIVNFFHPSISINKALWLYQLKGLDEETIDQHAKNFYTERIKPNFIKPVLKELIKFRDQGDKVIIVSAGYDAYLKYFIKEYGVELLCTRLLYEKHIFTGKIIGKDCIKNEKVNRIREFLKNDNLTGKNQSQIGYTDSESDIPLLSICDKKYVVRKKRSKDPEWIKTMDITIKYY